jgi:hemolysin activation/secretion protein
MTLFFIFGNHLAWSDVLPGPAFPEQVSKALSQPSTTVSKGIAPTIHPSQAEVSPLGEKAKKIKFKLQNLIISGNQLYSRQQLLPLYQDELGKVISVSDLFNIIQNITNYYRNHGYILSKAILPPQHINHGIVHVQIIEGYIGSVDVQGRPHGARCLVQAFGNKIRMCRPLSLDRMQKYLILANEIPATQVKAVLTPSKNQSGAADLTLVTQNQPITGYLSYDNYGTAYIGPQQMTANLGLNSMLLSGDSTQITVVKTMKGGELTYSDINYSTALDDNGTRWLIGATDTDTLPQFVLQPFDLIGDTTNFYTMIQYPVIRTLSSNLTWRTGFNYLDSSVTTNPNHATLYTDHIRSLDLGGSYNFADRWAGSNLLSGDFRQGLPIFGYTHTTDQANAQTSNPGGRADYTKFVAQISRSQAIRGPWSLYGVINGQWAFNPLLASEQFTFGGSQLGRGYDPAEIIGDRGASGSVELRYDWTLSKYFIQALQFYTFYDAGVVWNIEMPSNGRDRISATSFGVGTRFFFTKYVSGNIMWAQPLTKPVLTEQEENQVIVNGLTENRGNGKAPRVFFSIVAAID